MLKAEIIYEKFKKSINSVYEIYSKFKNIKMTKYFLKWRSVVIFRKKFQLLKEEIENNLGKKFEKEIVDCENKIKENEYENIQTKNTILKNTEIEANILKTINELEEKENNFIKSIQKLEEEKIVMQEEIDSIIIDKNKNPSILNSLQNQTNSLNDNQAKINNINKKDYVLKLEKKIKFLEKNLFILKDENIDKDKKISIYINEMTEILQYHDKNSNIFIFN